MAPSRGSAKLMQGADALANHCNDADSERSKDRDASPPSPLAGEGARRADEGDHKASKTAFARNQRRNMTDAERKLWYLLRGRRFSGFKFRRQTPIGRYIADFVCLERRLIVEADGSQHAESGHDAVRDLWLEQQGFRIRRFWNADILTAHQMVADTIWHDLMATPHPPAARAPSPARGEGGATAREAGRLDTAKDPAP